MTNFLPKLYCQKLSLRFACEACELCSRASNVRSKKSHTNVALSNGRDLYESIASQLTHGWNVIHAFAPGYTSIGEDQTSKSIGNEFDRNFLIEMRRQSDAIVTTGKTAIAENYRSSKFAKVSVLSENFDFKNSNLASRSPELNLLFTHRGSVADLVNQDETVVRKVLLNTAQEPFEQIKICLSETVPTRVD